MKHSHRSDANTEVHKNTASDTATFVRAAAVLLIATTLSVWAAISMSPLASVANRIS